MRWFKSLLVAFASSAGVVHAQQQPPAAAAPPPPPPSPSKLIVHEWGTFTSFAGSDGVSLEFRTEPKSDLPDFIVDRHRQAFVFDARYAAGDRSLVTTKAAVRSSLRMETPVTYFYTDEPMTVTVRVDYPQGLLTEFYPPVHMMMPLYHPRRAEPVGNSTLQWIGAKLIPPALATKAHQPPPTDDAHYAAAREVDAAFVQVDDRFTKKQFNERFLFYRGVGRANPPIRMTASPGGRFTITHAFPTPLRAGFLVSIESGAIRYANLGRLDAKVEATLPADASSLERLSEDMVAALVADGLYEKEARAMVKTWKQDWFAEEGTRLLYLLPQASTDAMIPLHVTPTPAATVRTMVGRYEVLTPETERRVERLIATLGAESFKDRDAATAALSRLGRFAEPSLQRILKTSDDPEVHARAKQLLARTK